MECPLFGVAFNDFAANIVFFGKQNLKQSHLLNCPLFVVYRQAYDPLYGRVLDKRYSRSDSFFSQWHHEFTYYTVSKSEFISLIHKEALFYVRKIYLVIIIQMQFVATLIELLHV